MQEVHTEINARRYLLMLFIMTLLLGCLVLVLKSDYRIKENQLSNLDYYPHVTSEEGFK